MSFKQIMKNFEDRWEEFTHKIFVKMDDAMGDQVRSVGNGIKKGITYPFEKLGSLSNKSTELKDNKVTQTATYILEQLGGHDNVLSFTNCMTRLRVKVNDNSKVNEENIKTYENAMGLAIAGNEYQIILGPGFVRKVTNTFGKLSGVKQGAELSATTPAPESGEEIEDDGTGNSLASATAANKAARKAANNSPIQLFLAKFAKIFTPMIFGFIGAGILGGIAGIIQSSSTVPAANGVGRVWLSATAQSWYTWLNLMIDGWKGAFIIIVGWRTAEVFGGSGVIGGIASVVFVSQFGGLATGMYVKEFDANGYLVGVNFLGIDINPATEGHWLTVGFDGHVTEDANGNWDGYSMSYARGAVFGALIIAGLSVPIENKVREHMPGALDMVLGSTITIFILLVLNYFLVIPVSGYMFMAVAWLFTTLAESAIGAAFLGAIFLLTVVFGIHQGFVPVYTALIDTVGVNTLFPILAMAGAGQVGVGLALLLKSDEGSMIRNQIKGAIIPAFMGIGEPMIYGITLPRPKTFVASMFGGFFGGLIMGMVNQFGADPIGLNSQFGPSGLLALPMMTSVSGNLAYAMSVYCISLLTAYGSGFIFTYLIGTRGVDLS